MPLPAAAIKAPIQNDPADRFWVCWRIRKQGPDWLCGRSIYPMPALEAIALMNSAKAMWGKTRVWAEKAAPETVPT